jgi:signal transduction histidine kinase
MPFSVALKTVRHLALLGLALAIWGLVLIIHMERFVPPFDRLLYLLMPWKSLYFIPPTVGIQDRLAFMQNVLASSQMVADVAFLIMVFSFVAFSVYLTLVYQQRQRRARENTLLTLKNREIARRNEFIRFISATIGHEFKNNLGRIKRRIDLLDLPPESRSRLYSNLDKLFADIDVFKKISDEREAGLVEFEGVNLRDLLQSLSRQFSDLADFSFRGDVAAATTIYAAPALLLTVLENLVDNAVKYRKPEQPRARITVACSLDSDGTRRYVSLSIRDEGIGMTEEEAERCFYKGKTRADGWGEGLYFAKYVVGLHAGKIRVGKEYTAPGRGTEFIIHLPFVEEAFGV